MEKGFLQQEITIINKLRSNFAQQTPNACYSKQCKCVNKVTLK